MEDAQILYLEPDEEIPSILDRIKEFQNNSLLLVVPKSSIVLQSVINLKLLLRIATKNKLKIAVVSSDPIGRNLTAQVGIAVYDSINSKTPVLEPKPKNIDKDEVIEVDLSSSPKPAVKVHHFQDNPEQSEQTDDSVNDSEDNLKVEEGQPIQHDLNTSDYLQSTEIPKIEQPNDQKITQTVVQSGNYLANSKPKKKKGWLVALITFLLVIGLGLLIFLPKAFVEVSVIGESFDKSFDINVSKDVKQAEFESQTIPGQIIEIIKEGSKKVTATGKKNIGEKANGPITLANNWSTDPQTLVAGTKLSKDDKTFLLLADKTIPGASLTLKEGQVVTNPGTITGNIEATEAGDSYNITAGRFSIGGLSSDKKDKIYGQTDKALTGGSNKEITIISTGDVELAKETVRSEIATQVKNDLTSQAKGQLLLEKAIVVETLEAKPSEPEGTQVNEFELKVKARARAEVFNESSFRDVFLDSAKKSVPSDKELVQTDNGTTEEIITSVKNINYDEGKLVISGTLKTKIGPKLDLPELKNKIAGKSIDQASEIVKSKPGIQEQKISVSPNWLLGKLPFSANQISIRVNYK